MAPSTYTLTSSSTFTFASTPIPTVDLILLTNEYARKLINNILNCSCLLDLQIALILILIVSKVITWYNAVEHPVDTTKRDLHLPVTMGKYKVDNIDKNKMHPLLLLSKLQHVVRLVE
ncbi:hypothetical protein MMC22_000176 [Lobaria immixta]|nr:hypothetical protein [Lobaria immixta]